MPKKAFFLLLILFTAFLWGQKSPVQADTAIIKVDYLNIRTGPGTDHQRIGQVHSNQRYSIIEEKNNWLKIKWNGKEAWVAKWLTNVQKDKKPTVTNSYSSKVDYLRIRSEAGLHGSIKGYLMKGDLVSAGQKKGNWIFIEDGQVKGWVHSGYMTKKESNIEPPSQPAKETPQKKPETAADLPTKGKIKVGTAILNVRSQGSTKGNVMTQIRKNQVYDYINEQDRWVQIKLEDGRIGWVAGWLVNKVKDQPETNPATPSTSTLVSLQYNGTNLRSGPSTSYEIVGKGNKGEEYKVINKQGQWYQILYGNRKAYVAGWIVTELEKEHKESSIITGSLKGRTIMIDAGHGGKDSGAVGRAGTYEKTLTLATSKKLKQLLESKGAKVLMTRDEDEYYALNIRTIYANRANIDAFISIHYNSAPWHVVASGVSSYYYHNRDKNLASSIQSEIALQTGLKNRGIHYGNFHVIRETKKPSVLLELGFVSDAREEQTIRSSQYQKKVSEGIVKGLINYFN